MSARNVTFQGHGARGILCAEFLSFINSAASDRVESRCLRGPLLALGVRLGPQNMNVEVWNWELSGLASREVDFHCQRHLRE
jgi:hypothetical protein